MTEITSRSTTPARGRPSTGAREAILTATLEVLADDGLAQLTTRDVARRAGVSEASVFYHFGDKAGLLQEAMVAGLGPLKDVDPEELAGRGARPLGAVLADLAAALDRFFERAMPIFTSVQSDGDLRAAFAARLTEGDRGPHRGVQLIGGYLDAMKANGQVDPAADSAAIALLLVGAGFLRAWQRQLLGTGTRTTLPSTGRTVRALVDLVKPSEDPTTSR